MLCNTAQRCIETAQMLTRDHIGCGHLMEETNDDTGKSRHGTCGSRCHRCGRCRRRDDVRRGTVGVRRPPPPNCTAADLAQVTTGVSAATSVYLFNHPDVNAFLTDLEGSPRDTVRARIADYMAANPQVQTELSGIRQPLVDMRNRCGGPSDDGS